MRFFVREPRPSLRAANLTDGPAESVLPGKRIIILALCLVGLGARTAGAQQPRLTMYNQNFAVVRVAVPLDLKAGVNRIRLSDVTAYLEPNSVILRDPTGQYPLRILEQNYRADPVTQGSMLQRYEGKTINFLVVEDGHAEITPGKIIRSGYVPPGPPYNPYQPQYAAQPQIPPGARQPIIEVNGQLRFSLPGQPLFPALAAGSILKPILSWVIQSQKAGHVNAELSYITSGMDWDATYNVIEPRHGKTLSLVGWVTMHNHSGMTFHHAQIDLMAGTVHKLQPQAYGYAGGMIGGMASTGMGGPQPPLVTQQPFDEYHLYTLHRPVTLRDQETKQIEFIHASGIQSRRYYVYDGVWIPPNQYNGWNMDMIRQNRDYGTQSTPQVRVMRSFANTSANHLGLPLPAGRLRFYRENSGGNLEFLGEARVKHTAANDRVRAYTGNAYDLAGDRRRTNYVIDTFRRTLDESFEIRLRNHKTQPVEIRIIEPLYRGRTWEILQHSDPFVKQNSQTIEFRVQVPANGEKTVTYTVHYTW